MHTYVARYQTPAARQRVQDAIMAAQPAWQPHLLRMAAPQLASLLQPAAYRSHLTGVQSVLPSCNAPPEACAVVCGVSSAFMQLLMSADFIHAHGMYLLDSPAMTGLAARWLSSSDFCTGAASGMRSFAQCGLDILCSLLRHRSAREQVRDTFARVLLQQGHGSMELSVPSSYDTASMLCPLAATDAMLAAQSHAVMAMQHGKPLLLTGSVGCGKSAAAAAAAWLQGRESLGLEFSPGESWAYDFSND